MDVLAGPFLASAALLVVAGAGKLRAPLPLARALRLAGLPVGVPAVRVGAAVEVLIGAAAICTGSVLAAAGVAGSYALFTGFVLLGLRRGGVLSSCGCFGTGDTPPTWAHVGVTGAAALVAGVVAMRPLGPLPDLLAGSPGLGLPLVVTTAAVAVAAYVVLAVLPLLAAARTPAR